MEAKKITESEENEIYLVISKALQALCREKPNDAIDFLSKKMLEIVGDDPKWANQKKKTTEKRLKANEEIMITNEKLHNKGFIRKFSDYYKIKKKIGLGPKGNTFKIQDLKRNDESRIVKMMKKKSGINSLTLTELNIETLLNLDHPNIGLIYDIIEDEKFVYMVQDYYEQGDLFNFILKNGKINEKLCKIIIKQLLCAVKYLHENNICHREVKPQNIFIIKYDEKDINETMVKLVDFGASCYFKDCIPLTEFPGNPFYSAPEVINGEYDQKIDIWSIGVISYFLLCGFPPFSGKEYDVLFKILNNPIDFSIIENEKARNFVQRLLEKNLFNRPEAEEILEDEWLLIENTDYIDDKLGIKIFSNMSKFIVGDSLRRSVYSYIISQKYYSESNENMLKLFRECDINNDGKIDGEELMISYGRYFPGAPEDQIEKIQQFIDKVDINKSGSIEYSEFLTVNNLINNDLNKKMLKEVFDFFDVTKNGTIQVDDLREIFEDTDISDAKLNNMLREFDKNGDSEITFNEFYELLTSMLDKE